ncbi:hypothetical protein GWI33_017388 [Rhynchophorus ferrugineus]|uniref:Uncharacterized protein n=1 Tax=Rhynchophorus ferrugineus TaxID=354439 RepID=A0A834J187_RHYFE|nr:hypothetical protein GWI33_017388 [Rhynchophorus ferrugineus]
MKSNVFIPEQCSSTIKKTHTNRSILTKLEYPTKSLTPTELNEISSAEKCRFLSAMRGSNGAMELDLRRVELCRIGKRGGVYGEGPDVKCSR